MKKLKLGFTLIELLIVIALLGALAVALLAALDPLEQIRKGTDTGVRNTVAEIHGGAIRYSALKGGVLPFSTTGTIPWTLIGSGTNMSPEGSTFIQNIVDAGELKSDFTKLAGTQLDRIYITGLNGSSDYKVSVCYAPQAKSFKLDANTKFGSANGEVVETTDCPNAAGSGTSGVCLWCVR